MRSGTASSSSGGGGPTDQSLSTEVTLAPGSAPQRVDAGRRSAARRVARGEAGRIPVDVFVPVLHGTFGEDGCIQGAARAGRLCVRRLRRDGIRRRHEQARRRRSWRRRPASRSCRGFRASAACSIASHGWLHELARTSRRHVRLAGHRQALQPWVERGCVARRPRRHGARRRRAQGVRVRRRSAHRAVHQEPARDQRRRRRTRRARGLRHRDAADAARRRRSRSARSTSARDARASARARAWPARCACWTRRICRRRCARARGSYADHRIRRARMRGDLAHRLPDRRRQRTSSIFNEINTLPGSLAFYLWSAAPHYWTITDLLTRLIERAERLRAIKRGLQRKPPSELKLLG